MHTMHNPSLPAFSVWKADGKRQMSQRWCRMDCTIR